VSSTTSTKGTCFSYLTARAPKLQQNKCQKSCGRKLRDGKLKDYGTSVCSRSQPDQRELFGRVEALADSSYSHSLKGHPV
jgi:hypothetical protein